MCAGKPPGQQPQPAPAGNQQQLDEDWLVGVDDMDDDEENFLVSLLAAQLACTSACWQPSHLVNSCK